MPANAKYLNKNPWQRFAKITCGLFGGYLITALLHMISAILLPWHQEVLVTAIASFYIIWCALIIIPFTFKRGWLAWIVYLLIILGLGILYYFILPYNPFVHE